MQAFTVEGWKTEDGKKVEVRWAPHGKRATIDNLEVGLVLCGEAAKLPDVDVADMVNSITAVLIRAYKRKSSKLVLVPRLGAGLLLQQKGAKRG